jgi:hypothetical protein
MVDGIVFDIVEAPAMNLEIQRKTEMQFDLAKSTSIIRSSLHQLVGYCPSTTKAMNLLKGVANIPLDINKPTSQLIWEVQFLWQQLSPKHQPVTITPDNYCYYWGKANEGILSAISAKHFGHWKALTRLRYLVQFICTQLNLIAKSGKSPSQWGVGLQVLLKKCQGCPWLTSCGPSY